MLHTTDLYYFSPTGGTKKAAEAFCMAISDKVNKINLGIQNLSENVFEVSESELLVAAAPVFAGRIPAFAAERFKKMSGNGKYAVALAVYGVRAYDDALLELNNILTECGFKVIASAALVAEHSVVREVGAGRPDAQDLAEIQAFADKVLTILDGADKLEGTEEKMEQENAIAPVVPGNYPYRAGMKTSATPISTESCNFCGACKAICPTGAIEIADGVMKTKLEKCMMCMACVAHCPQNARMLPPQMQAGMNQMLGKLKDVRRANEFFLILGIEIIGKGV